MANRNLLPKHFLPDFKVWLEAHGHETRPTTAQFQVLQVRLVGDPRWHGIYEKLTRNPHYSVTQPMVKITEQFVYEKKYANHHPAPRQ